MARKAVSKAAGVYLLSLLDKAKESALEKHRVRYSDEHRAELEAKADAFHELRGVLSYYAGKVVP